MQQIPLVAQTRTVLGRKVKKLRQEGLIPAHVFGHKIKTIHVQVNHGDFSKVFEKAGETAIVELAVDGQKHPTLIRNVQTHPVTDEPLHVDFYQVNLTEKVKVNVPLQIVGESPAVEKKLGLLLTPVSEVEIEALPTDIPEHISIDITKLENVGQEIKLKDLPIDRAKITVDADEELVVAQIGELVTKEMEAVEAEIEAEQAAVTAEAAPTEAPAVGEEAKQAEAPAGTEAEAGAKPAPEKAEKAPADQTEKPAPTPKPDKS